MARESFCRTSSIFVEREKMRVWLNRGANCPHFAKPARPITPSIRNVTTNRADHTPRTFRCTRRWNLGCNGNSHVTRNSRTVSGSFRNPLREKTFEYNSIDNRNQARRYFRHSLRSFHLQFAASCFYLTRGSVMVRPRTWVVTFLSLPGGKPPIKFRWRGVRVAVKSLHGQRMGQ